VKIIKILPASDFNPAPKVASAIISLKTTPQVNFDTQVYYAAVHALFAQPRKTLINNLAAATGEKGGTIAQKLSTIGIQPTFRPQNLDLDNIVAVAKVFFAP
jgi:16S rRNA (adenine1518-N6/adenine1519-N6)-dimethyltransferase